MPAAIATKNAYVCSQPRIRGLPMSTGRRRPAGVRGRLSGHPLRLRHRRLLVSSDREREITRRSRQARAAMEIRPVGALALLPRASATVRCARRGGRELWRRRAAGEFAATDIVPGARTMLVDGVPTRPRWPGDRSAGRRRHDRGVRRGGAGGDPHPVRRAGPRRGRASTGAWPGGGRRAAHRDTEFRVAFCGFAPGFAYMTGLPPIWRYRGSRRPGRGYRPAASGSADMYCGDLPDRVAGRLAADRPYRRACCSTPDRDAAGAAHARRRACGSRGSRMIEIGDAPARSTTVQDLGRPGWAHLGVPRSGALDAARAAPGQPAGRQRPTAPPAWRSR